MPVSFFFNKSNPEPRQFLPAKAASLERSRGSILLLTLMMGSVMLLLTASFNSSVRGKIDMSRDGSNLMGAEFTVESLDVRQIRVSYPGVALGWHR